MAEVEIVSTVGKVLLVEGFWLPSKVRIKIRGDADDPLIPYEGEARLEFQGGRHEIVDLRVRQVDGGPPVTGDALRRIPTPLADAVLHSLAQRWPEVLREILEAPPGARSVAAKGPTREALALAALVYRFAYLSHQDPTNTVARELGLARSTAGRWIMRARKAGLLGPTEEGKPGERKGD